MGYGEAVVKPIVEERKDLHEYISWLNQIANKWRTKWEESRIHEANPSNKPKFFLTAAFPYPNGMMHLGHARTYTLTDIYARFKRLEGYNVLFPMGFHYTGTPVLAMADAIKEGDEKTLKLFRELYCIPDEEIEKMKDPLYLVRYFHKNIKESMKLMGYMIDWRREFTSIDTMFSSFIHWQFKKLYEKGYITRGTHPVGWDPVIGTPVSMHDTKGDVEPEIGEFTLLFFETGDGAYMPAATLRPETVFGAVNVWVNPKAVYVDALVDEHRWIISKEAVDKLRLQLRKVKILREFRGEELIGKRVRNPATGWRVPILPAEFVDTDTATGIVMSVPAHAPYDYAALKDILRNRELLEKLGIRPEELMPKTVVRVPGVSNELAVDVVEEMGISSQLEHDKLEEATKRVYSIEFKQGIVVEDIVERVACGIRDQVSKKYIVAAVKTLIAGKPVPEAREATALWLRNAGLADSMYEIINKPVYSRWGNKVVVKILENQWFINYGIEDWKKLVREALASMNIVPLQMRKEFEETIEWVKKRACARTKGLGTRLPWDREWVIESLSDSTIYMAFYTINHILRKYGIKADQLTYEVWDYILLGKGDSRKLSRKTGIPEEALKEAREEFDYWYPLDSRHSGKDLVKNHLTFFIFNHVAIFPRTKWPRQIAVNGYVLYRGQKMSKSLFNVIPVQQLASVLSPDGLRLAIAISSEIDQDLDFREETAYSVIEQLRRIHNMIVEHRDIIVNYRKKELPNIIYLEDAWIMSKLREISTNAKRSLNQLRIREAANMIYYIFEEYIKKYIDIIKTKNRYFDEISKHIIAYVFDSWIRMMAPYTPFFAEEMWKIIGGEDFIINTSWPTVDDKYFSPQALLSMEYIDRLINDIREIVRVRKGKPKKIMVYVVDPGAYGTLRKAIEYIVSGRTMKEFIRDIVMDAVDKRRAANIARKVYGLASSLPLYLRDLILATEFDEKKAIEALHKWIKKQVEAPLEVRYVNEARELRGKEAYPLKPAIYIEFE